MGGGRGVGSLFKGKNSKLEGKIPHDVERDALARLPFTNVRDRHRTLTHDHCKLID